ncbi:Synaptic vesicular amine transporter, partial [Operophtera brumata]
MSLDEVTTPPPPPTPYCPQHHSTEGSPASGINPRDGCCRSHVRQQGAGPPFGGLMYEFVGKTAPFLMLSALALGDG